MMPVKKRGKVESESIHGGRLDPRVEAELNKVLGIYLGL